MSDHALRVEPERELEENIMAFKVGLAVAVLLSSSTMPLQDRGPAAEVAEVRAVLARYQQAIERLDARGTESLFAPDSAIFESGSFEGTYSHYLAHHLQPEFGQFKSFKFSEYSVTVRVEGPIALASEVYHYRIEPKEGEATEMQGVATSALQRVGGRWQIVSMHNSGRKLRVKR